MIDEKGGYLCHTGTLNYPAGIGGKRGEPFQKQNAEYGEGLTNN